MRRFTKDQIQKFILSLVGLVGLLYCYQTFLLGPLLQNTVRMKSATSDYQQKVERGQKVLNEMTQLEKEAPESVARAEKLAEMNPAGAPVAWFPPMVKSFFADDKIEITGIRLVGLTPLKNRDLAAYAKTDWAVEMAHVDFRMLGERIAQLENEWLLSNIGSVRIQAVPEDPAGQKVTLGMFRIVKQ